MAFPRVPQTQIPDFDGNPNGILRGPPSQIIKDPTLGKLWIKQSLQDDRHGWKDLTETEQVISVQGNGDWSETSGTGSDDTAEVLIAVERVNAIASNQLLGIRPTLYFPPASGYRVTSEVRVNENVNVIMDGPLIIDAPNIVGLTIGRTQAVNFVTRHQIQVIRATQSSWLSEQSIGVKFINANSCDILIQMAKNNTIGAQFIGSGALCGYNNVRLGLINNNKYGLDLTSLTVAGVIGVTNQNTFYGGRFDLNSGVGAGLARYGVRFTSQDAAPPNSAAISNNNVFLNPSFELQVGDSGGADNAVPFLSVYGNLNHAYDVRSEGNSPAALVAQNSSYDNVVETRFGGAIVSNAGDYMSNFVRQHEDHIFSDIATMIWHSGALHKTACFYDGAGVAMHVPKCHIATSGGANVLAALTGLTIASTYLEIGATRGVGVLIDTSVAKRFLVRKDVVSAANGGYMAIRCYDSGGSVYTTLGAVKSTPYSLLARDLSVYGGVFISGSPSDGEYIFEVTDAVKQIAVIIATPSGVAQIRSFSIYTLDGKTATCFPGYEEIFPGANLMTTPPTTGTWIRGRHGWNVNPASGQPLGWSCISGGTPGTWAAWANVA